MWQERSINPYKIEQAKYADQTNCADKMPTYIGENLRRELLCIFNEHSQLVYIMNSENQMIK